MEIFSALRLLREHIDRSTAWRLCATAALILLAGLLAGLGPLALKAMIDATQPGGLERSTSVRVWSMAAAYLLALLTGRLLIELRPSIVGIAEQSIYGSLRRGYLAHLLDLPLAFHRERQSGALTQILQQATVGYQIILFNLINSVLPVLIELITVLLVLNSLGEPLLLSAFVASAAAYLGALRFRASQLRFGAREVAESSIAVQAMMSDALLNIETIKGFGLEDSVRARFYGSTSLLESRWSMLQRERLRVGLAVTGVFAISMVTLLAVSVRAVLEGTLSAGGFILSNVYMLQLARPLEALGAATRDLSQAAEFVRPLIEVLNQSTETSKPDPHARFGIATHIDWSDGPVQTRASGSRNAKSLRLRDVSFAYPDGTQIFQGLSLDIEAGQHVAIVGASGSGKTSLIRLLLRFEEPQSGGILLDERPVRVLPARETRMLIAVIPQDITLFNDTLAFNIGVGKVGATSEEIEGAAQIAEAHEFIQAFPMRYETIVGERGAKLSGGERQRIAIARAILKGPGLYIFDEATSMLDALTESRIMRNLREILRDATTITVAHRLSTVRDADEIIVLDAGRIVERGRHVDLLRNGHVYAAMWQEQEQGPDPYTGQPSDPCILAD